MKEKLNEYIVMSLMKQKGYVSAHSLANELKVSNKTIRRRIKLINEGIIDNIGKIESKKGEGYRLLIYNKEEFSKFYDYYIAEVEISNSINRRAVIFEYLTDNPGCTKLELSEIFYVSETTLSKDIRELNKYTKNVNVEIVSVQDNGLEILGGEYYIRNTLLKLIYDSGNARARRRDTRNLKGGYADQIINVFQKEYLLINKHTLDAIVNYLTMSSRNISMGRYLEEMDFNENDLQFYDLAQKLHKVMSDEMKIKFPINETKFLSLFLKSVLPMELIKFNRNDVLNETVNKCFEITKNIVKKIGLGNVIDSCKDDIYRFLYTLTLRIKFDIQRRLINYIGIETTHSQAYFISKLIFEELENFFSCVISKEEIAYFALIINNYFFTSNKDKKILAILPSDYTVARIYISELHHFDNYKIDLVDYETLMKQTDVNDKYSLIINPFENMIPVSNIKMYNISDVITREDFLAISRMLSYKNYNQVLNNIARLNQINENVQPEELLKTINENENSFCSTFFGSYICFSSTMKVETMNYAIFGKDSNRQLCFIINNNLNADEISDLLRVAIDTIIKYISNGEVMDKEKLIEYYSK